MHSLVGSHGHDRCLPTVRKAIGRRFHLFFGSSNRHGFRDSRKDYRLVNPGDRPASDGSESFGIPRAHGTATRPFLAGSNTVICSPVELKVHSKFSKARVSVTNRGTAETLQDTRIELSALAC